MRQICILKTRVGCICSDALCVCVRACACALVRLESTVCACMCLRECMCAGVCVLVCGHLCMCESLVCTCVRVCVYTSTRAPIPVCTWAWRQVSKTYGPAHTKQHPGQIHSMAFLANIPAHEYRGGGGSGGVGVSVCASA